MCFLWQTLLFCGACLMVWILHGLLHAPLWVGGVGGCLFLIAAWIGYLNYQVKHPDWWPPWDEGLPQVMRMINVFIPVAGVFILVMLMLPVFKTVHQKVIQHRHLREMRRQHRLIRNMHSLTEQ